MVQIAHLRCEGRANGINEDVRTQAAQPPTDRQYRRFHRLKISDNGRTRVPVKILIAMKLAGGGGGRLPAKGP